MASQPLKRIYFDTNILYRWPHPPNDIYSICGVAKRLGTQLLMPEVVERELEARFIRSANAAYDTAEQNIKEINKLCRDVITVDIAGRRPKSTLPLNGASRRRLRRRAICIVLSSRERLLPEIPDSIVYQALKPGNRRKNRISSHQ